MEEKKFKVYLKEKQELIDSALDSLLSREDIFPMILHRAMRYSVLAPGKRIRPILCLAACMAVGGKEEDALAPACALEMIHAYSLIHDDLPAMDDDDLRRGRPTLHRAFNEGTAILAGDALLTLAFEVVAVAKRLTDRQVRQIITELAIGAGHRGMVGGQQADLNAEGKTITPEELKYIHSHKTGALLVASVLCGAIIGDAGPKQMVHLKKYGQANGLAFQIKDDLLDIEGKSAKLGKSTGQDKKAEKATYPSIWGIEASREKLKEATATAFALLESFGEEAEPLREIARFIGEREA
ncbi:MAG: polyprenyl synthetase family protein [Candidatus Euphemobacter frigidus]|nr:polyprenyl synthetase family protein [Candidatus Euphemobacter frigidus]MDP8275964.1 polyprenyl synthetase family protein [Candidatus Euphemobacter frigidus]